MIYWKWFSTLAMSCLHLLMNACLALRNRLGVVVFRATCFEGRRFSGFPIGGFAVCWIVWLVLIGGKIRWRCFLHLVYWTVCLLSVVLCCEMRSCSSLMVMNGLFCTLLFACCWSVSILGEVICGAHLVSINRNIKHGISVMLVRLRFLEMGVLKMLHLLLLHHLLLLILTKSIKLVVLHILFLLHVHRFVLIWVCEEVVLLYIMRLLHTWRGFLILYLLDTIVKAVKIFLRQRSWLFAKGFDLGWLKNRY